MLSYNRPNLISSKIYSLDLVPFPLQSFSISLSLIFFFVIFQLDSRKKTHLTQHSLGSNIAFLNTQRDQTVLAARSRGDASLNLFHTESCYLVNRHCLESLSVWPLQLTIILPNCQPRLNLSVASCFLRPPNQWEQRESFMHTTAPVALSL